MTEPEFVQTNPRTGAGHHRWMLPPPRPGFCYAPWHTYHSGDGVAIPGALEYCANQCCAGHRWTHCHDCGRSGDRAGDECQMICIPYPS